MLILTRRSGESLRIGDDVSVTVLGRDRFDQIRLGVTAPLDVSIHREEVYQRIKLEKEQQQEAANDASASA